MIKKTIKFVDFDGNKREEEHYFNLTKAEVMDMEIGVTGGMSEMLKRMIAAQDMPSLYRVINDIIKKSYGIKSPDGRKFMKSQEIWEDFYQTEAYSELMMELASDEKKAADFINALMPADLAKYAEKAEQATLSIPEAAN